MEKFVKTFESIEPLRLRLKEECVEFLKRILPENNGEVVINSNEAEDDDIYVTVTYDGGNHPEYASDAFSYVYDVHTDKDGKVYLNIEDDEDYEVERVSPEELYYVCDAVLGKLNTEN